MSTPARNRQGRYTRGVATMRRDIEAADLRARGHSYGEIATIMGFASRATAFHAVERAIADLDREPVEAVRRMELHRLDIMYKAALGVLERQHLMVSQGKIISRVIGTTVNQDTGEVVPIFEELTDDAPVLQAIDRLIKIQERRARLLGLDAPARLELMTMDAIDAEIARLQAELGAGQPDGQSSDTP